MTWRPKLTGYRILVLTLPTSFTIAKAIIEYKGKRGESKALDWVISTLIANTICVLGNYEQHHPKALAWFFFKDYAPMGATDTEELDPIRLKAHHPQRPALTGFRVLLTVLTCGFGLAKAAMAYNDMQTTPAAIELVFVVAVGTAMFWFGLYERSKRNPYPAFFTVDHSLRLKQALERVKIIFAIGLSISWIYWIQGQVQRCAHFWFKSPPLRTFDGHPPILWPILEAALMWLIGTMFTALLCLMTAVGPLAACMLCEALITSPTSSNHTFHRMIQRLLTCLIVTTFAVSYFLAHVVVICFGVVVIGLCSRVFVSYKLRGNLILDIGCLAMRFSTCAYALFGLALVANALVSLFKFKSRCLAST